MSQRHGRLRARAAVVGLVVATALPLVIVARADPGPSPRDADVALIRQFEADLRSGQLRGDGKASIEGKLEALKQRVREEDEEARKPRVPKVPPPPGPSPTPRAPQPDAIYDVLQPPISSSFARITNAWAGDEPDGSRTTVMAGVLTVEGTGRPGPWGMVVVNNTAGDAAALGPAKLVRTPTAEGSVRIISAAGHRLLLEAENGVRFTFDVDTREFVAPGREPSP